MPTTPATTLPSPIASPFGPDEVDHFVLRDLDRLSAFSGMWVDPLDDLVDAVVPSSCSAAGWCALSGLWLAPAA